jgi:pyrimidine-nucleoside phosphorylase
VLGDAVDGLERGRELFDEAISSGRALARFREIIRIQEGNPAVVEDYSLFPQARHQSFLLSGAGGYIESMDTERIGVAMSILGAGRETLDSVIDHAVGMRVHKKIGDAVAAGEALCTVSYNDERRFREAAALLMDSYSFSEKPPVRPALIKKVIT